MIPSSDWSPQGKRGWPPFTQSTPPDEHKNPSQHCPHGITQFLQVTAEWELLNEWNDATDLKYGPRAISIAPSMKRSLLHWKIKPRKALRVPLLLPLQHNTIMLQNNAAAEGVRLAKFQNEEMQLKSSPPLRKRWGIPDREHPQCSRALQSC